jgi:hypothetical protein
MVELPDDVFNTLFRDHQQECLSCGGIAIEYANTITSVIVEKSIFAGHRRDKGDCVVTAWLSELQEEK